MTNFKKQFNLKTIVSSLICIVLFTSVAYSYQETSLCLRNPLGINKERYKSALKAASGQRGVPDGEQLFPLARKAIDSSSVAKFFETKSIPKIQGMLEEAVRIIETGSVNGAFVLLEQMEEVISITEISDSKEIKRLTFLRVFENLTNVEKGRLKAFIKNKKTELPELFEITDVSLWLDKRGVGEDPLHNQKELKEWLAMGILNLNDIWQGEKLIAINNHNFRLVSRRNRNVYHAVNVDTGEKVVIKTSDEREALISRIVYRLGVGARVIDYDANNYFMVIEDVGGKTLSEISNEGSLTLGMAVDVLSKAGEYAEILRQRGIVHNDIASRNIIVSEKGIFLIDYSHAFFSTRLAGSTDFLKLGYLLETLSSPNDGLLKNSLNPGNTKGLSKYALPLVIRIVLEEAKERLDRGLSVSWPQDYETSGDETIDFEPVRAKLAEFTGDGKIESLPVKSELDINRFMDRLRLPLDGFAETFAQSYLYPFFPEGIHEFIIRKISESEGGESYEAFNELLNLVQSEGQSSRGIFAEYLRWYYTKSLSKELKLSTKQKAGIWREAIKIHRRFGVFATTGFLRFAPYLANAHGLESLTAFTDVLLYKNVRYVAPADSISYYDQLRYKLWQENKVMQSFNYADSWMTFSIKIEDGIEYVFSFGVDADLSLKIAEVWKKEGKLLGYGGNSMTHYHANLAFRIFENEKDNVSDRALLYNARIYLISKMFPRIRTILVSPSQFGGEGSAAAEYAMRAGTAIFYIKKIGMRPALNGLPAEQSEEIKIVLKKLQAGLRLDVADLLKLAITPMGMGLSDDWKEKTGKRVEDALLEGVAYDLGSSSAPMGKFLAGVKDVSRML